MARFRGVGALEGSGLGVFQVFGFSTEARGHNSEEKPLGGRVLVAQPLPLGFPPALHSSRFSFHSCHQCKALASLSHPASSVWSRCRKSSFVCGSRGFPTESTKPTSKPSCSRKTPTVPPRRPRCTTPRGIARTPARCVFARS